MRLEFLGEGERFSHQAPYALAEREVEPLYMIGLSLLLGAGLMLFLGEDALVTFEQVGVAQARFIGRRNLLPQAPATDFVTGTIPPGYDLTRSSAQSEPNPHLILLAFDERPDLVQFQNVLLVGR